MYRHTIQFTVCEYLISILFLPISEGACLSGLIDPHIILNSDTRTCKNGGYADTSSAPNQIEIHTPIPRYQSTNTHACIGTKSGYQVLVLGLHVGCA